MTGTPTHPLPVIHTKPVHIRWRFIGLVAAGGLFGTAAREGLALAIPEFSAFPTVIFGINLLGAFLLGFLLEALARRGADTGMRRVLRLGVGTGVLGGFTTYSTFALGVAQLIDQQHDVVALVYGLGTVVAGAVATVLGIVVATAVHARGSEA